MADYRLNTKQQEAVEATEGRVKVLYLFIAMLIS